MTPERSYTPIACGLVDELQLRALRRVRIRLSWREGDGMRTAEERIADVRTRDGAEFALLSDGTEIRLDDLVEVDGIAFGANC